MLKLFLLLTLLYKLSFGCAACSLMVPSVELDMKLDVVEKKLNNIHFTWNFSWDYTQQIIQQFDKNNNLLLDKNELDSINDAMLEYLRPKSMLSSLEFSDENSSEPKTLKPKYENFNLEVVDELLVFSYDAKLKKEITNNSILSVALEDDEGYYTFSVRKLSMNENDFSYTKNLYLFTASILFKGDVSSSKIKEINTTKPIVQKVALHPIENEKIIQESYLIQSMNKIKSLFESIKDEKNPMTYLFLLFFAFVYGVIHAMGPGHGKTLVASYFLSNDRSYLKAFWIALAIGIVHTFSAFILTLVIYFVLNTLLAQFLDNTVYYTTKISALIIIFIALYLMYKKYKLYKIIQNKKERSFQFSTTPHISTCGCSSCKVDKDSTDIALIISAGIIPCPGTTTLFIFAISTGLYYAGFISALVMSLGMSSVIFISALFSTVIRKKISHSNENLKKYLEFASLTLILLLGGVLLLG